jgi:hypothetical protein
MKPDADFLDDLKESRGRVSRFAAICKSQGVKVLLYPEVVRPDAAVRSEYADDGDLLVMLRVEHKGRGLRFNNAADFPFDTVLVDEVYKIDRIQQRPFWYVSENEEGTRVVVVSSRTMPQWVKVKKFDKRQNRECEFYACPTHLCRFCDISEVF